MTNRRVVELVQADGKQLPRRQQKTHRQHLRQPTPTLQRLHGGRRIVMPFLDTHAATRRTSAQAKRKRESPTRQVTAAVSTTVDVTDDGQQVIDVTDENQQPSNTNTNANSDPNGSGPAAKRRRKDNHQAPPARSVEVITIDDDDEEEKANSKRVEPTNMAPAPTNPVPPTPPVPPTQANNPTSNTFSQRGEMAEQLESDDYFQVLGLSRSATDADVKKAYRKLALMWHPDKNPGNAKAEEYFKKIAEAYEVLSDPEKRKTYERYGKEGLDGGGSAAAGASGFYDAFGAGGRAGFSSRHAFDIFEAFFGGSDPFEELFGGGGGGRRRSSRARQREDEWDSFGFGGMSPMMMMGGFGFGGGSGSRRGGPGGFGSVMDSFFSDDFGGAGFGSSSSFSSFGGGGGFSKSVSTSSFTDRNGHVVTKKTTTTVNPDGQTETVTEEYRNGKLVNSSSSSTTSRLAGAGRMQLEGTSASAYGDPPRSSSSRSRSRRT